MHVLFAASGWRAAGAKALRAVRGLRVGLMLAYISMCAHEAHAQQSGDVRIGDRQDHGEIQSRELDEASGIAASRLNRDVYWSHNDSGDINRVFAIAADGRDLGTFILSGCPARDWEDIAVGPGPDPARTYLYVGDIGDNLGVWPEVVICRVVEPVVGAVAAIGPATLRDVAVLRLSYPDGPHNAEALLVDPRTRDIYIVTKQSREARVYVASYPHDERAAIKLSWVSSLPLAAISAGDISPDGSRILLKNLGNVWLWTRSDGASVAEALATSPQRLRYVREPLGEGIGWTADGHGYVTISERVFGLPPHLYFYPEVP